MTNLLPNHWLPGMGVGGGGGFKDKETHAVQTSSSTMGGGQGECREPGNKP